jgi:TPR repeat protein
MRRSRLITILSFFLSASFVSAQNMQQVNQLLSEQKYQAAFKILSYQAQKGDANAQYNLGLMLKKGLGQEPSSEQANFWFQQAARQGLLQAYNQLQSKSIAPGVGSRVKIEYTPEEWVKLQQPGHYTLQLASSTNKQLIEKYYLENNLQGKAGYYRNRRQGENWYALVYGSYPSASEANAAVTNLPADLRKWSPWVRKLKDIQRLMNH